MPSNESSSACEVIVESENGLNLEAAHTSKNISGGKALDDVSFDDRKGGRHELVGEKRFLFNPQGKG